MILFRNSVVAIIALLLTMQGEIAVTMPLCEHGSAGSTSLADTQQHAGMAHAHHVHAQDTDRETSQDTSSDKLIPEASDKDDLACDDCEFCALSCASTLPSAQLHDGAATGHGSRSSNETLLIGVTPHQLRKPPLLA